jgi:hypothetical protein
MLLLLHAFSTLFLAGLIWFVQVVHYPLFPLADRSRFETFAADHRRRTTLVVAPLMLLELTSASAIALAPPAGSAGMAWLGWGLLVVIWLSTALLQVPRHRLLSAGFDEAVARSLVSTNWIRTIGWSGRGIIALLLLGRGAPS